MLPVHGFKDWNRRLTVNLTQLEKRRRFLRRFDYDKSPHLHRAS